MPGLKRTALPGAMVTSVPVRGIASDAGFAGLDGEDTEATEFDAVACDRGHSSCFEDGVNGGFGFGPWKAGALNYPLYKVLLDQWRSPSWTQSHEVGKCLTVTAYTAMVESLVLVVNVSSAAVS